MINAWKLKNPVETNELSKNLFLFRFAMKRDLENVINNRLWSFDRNLLVLDRVSGEEQPLNLNMHFGVFWVMVYELPLMLRSEAMAKKIGGILGNFEEMDQKEAHCNGQFLRIKVKRDLKQPLKWGTIVRLKDKNLRVFLKYERLTNFCFAYRRIGHQLKDCKALRELDEESYEELDEQEISFGLWLRASPLPRVTEEPKKKDSSSGTCSKNLFNISSSHSRCETKSKGKEGDEVEVEQPSTTGNTNQIKTMPKPVEENNLGNLLAIEFVAESLGAVDISNKGKEGEGNSKGTVSKRRKGSRKKAEKKEVPNKNALMNIERGRDNL
ncbi:unnamed protein product [Vicia faba]|uniref:DUF4283 domain-containing protein n=1 Tax=Vicia faba TaxID=3906 RepID=A0AAV1ABI6_VICFA|nr:unnamed protein product [Vicia faba]